MSGSIKVKADDVLIFICRQSFSNFELNLWIRKFGSHLSFDADSWGLTKLNYWLLRACHQRMMK